MRTITNINLQQYLQTPSKCIDIHCNAFMFLQDQYICVRMEAISSSGFFSWVNQASLLVYFVVAECSDCDSTIPLQQWSAVWLNKKGKDSIYAIESTYRNTHALSIGYIFIALCACKFFRTLMEPEPPVPGPPIISVWIHLNLPYTEGLWLEMYLHYTPSMIDSQGMQFQEVMWPT